VARLMSWIEANAAPGAGRGAETKA
jgi:hypothetical protein